MEGLTLRLGFAPGSLAIWAALISGLASMGVYVYALRLAPKTPLVPSFDAQRNTAYDRAIGFARRLYYAFAFFIVLASCLLMRLLLSHDFRVSYVTSYSGLDLPFRYLFSTFWAGQEGSFLLWVLMGSLIGLVVLRTAKEQEPPVMTVYLASFLGIVGILAKQSPFRYLAQVPADGQGLNPLLQDPWMVIHPPVMFAGFASLSVPFAFAMAALWAKRWDGWVVRAMPWALFSFLTLGTAILMGGYWAYKTLGWGGYWAWDPVENTSLVPWLATAALVHGMFLQKARAKHRKINIILALLAFCCILYGTFLTRSGVLADFSVHSFVDLGITGWLVGIIVFFLVGGLGLLAYRWKEIPKEPTLDEKTGAEIQEPFLSRSVLFILSVTLFCASGLVILLGTSAPILTRIFGKASQVATSFYNVTHAPIAILMGLLIALVPFLSWRGETASAVMRKALLAFTAGVLGAGVAFVAGVRGPRDLLLIFSAAFGLAASLETLVLFVKRKAFASAGGYLAHAGVGVMLVGILISGAYERKAQITLLRGQPQQVGSQTFTFTRTVFVSEDGAVKKAEELDTARLSDRRAKQAMEVEVKGATGKVWKAYPKIYVNERTRQMMANPDLRSTPLMDLYLAPQAYDPGSPARTEGSVVTLARGESKSVHGTNVTFLGFSSDPTQMQAADPRIVVFGQVKIGEEEVQSRVTVVLPSDPNAEPQMISPVIPTASGKASVRLRNINPQGGTAELEILGLDPKGDFKAATPENFSVDITTKPLISLVWGGFYVLMGGAFLALLKRSAETRRAVMA
ncbi:MAG: cytochrome c biogenesis protein CcsA [Acidobacteria bacterium]|nr:cytochrome c biogenesis protein CcsA [Acidobacteriota bacterium]